MIKWLKNDFRSVRGALCFLVNKEVPLWISILYYVIAWIVLTPIGCVIALYYKIRLSIEVRQLTKRIENPGKWYTYEEDEDWKA